MAVTAIVAVLAVLITFSWIVIGSIRYAIRERAARIQCDSGSAFLERNIACSGVHEVEGRVLSRMQEIEQIVCRKQKTIRRNGIQKIDPEMTPRDLKAVDPLNDETRTMMAIRVKAEDISRMARKKAKA